MNYIPCPECNSTQCIYTKPIINTHKYGNPTSGEMVYHPRPVHPLEEENERLKRVIAGLWHRYVNDDVDGFTQLVKETLGELP